MRGELKLTESSAIILCVAEEAGLLGSSPAARGAAHMHFSLASETRWQWIELVYNTSAEAYPGAKDAFVRGKLRPRLAALAGALRRRGGPYLQGREMTYADVVWADLLEQLAAFAPDASSDLPELGALQSAVNGLPRIASYRASPRFIDRPVRRGGGRLVEPGRQRRPTPACLAARSGEGGLSS